MIRELIALFFIFSLTGISCAATDERILDGDFSDGFDFWQRARMDGGAFPVMSEGQVYFETESSGMSGISQANVDLTGVGIVTFTWSGSGSGNFKILLDLTEIYSEDVNFCSGNSQVDVSDFSGTYTLYFRLVSDSTSEVYLDDVSAKTSSLYRPTASATIAVMNEDSSDIIMSYLGIDQPYISEASTGMNLSALAGEVFGVYSDSGLGPFALLIVFCMPFVGLWIMQRDMIIPGGIGIMFSGFVLVRLPADFQGVAVMMIAVCVTAVIYSIYVRR
ncbi:hypothetical protein [Methanoplanus endosymbiosus]|uniref:Uncharacterized protein n=1 Tax=Methanoplanus endosymbiosus TaxID=33865 RepID=A0A9E7PRG8_9EURY|nr:hypothetical protein [Methanoplanus endosymbiosus]UUX93731.1 hypothetical protein L6E24_06350 [Methanoplanus endosymbiosus]